MVLDRARGQEQLGGDLRVGQARLDQPRDLGLLGGELLVRASGAPAGGLAGGPQLAAGPFGERLHADRVEHVVRGAQLRPRVGPAPLAAQPLAVEQVRAGQFGPEAGAAQPVDRFAVAALGVLAVAEQRPGTRVDPLPPVGLADAGRLGQPAERLGGQLGLPGPAWPPRSARAAPTSRHAAQLTAQRPGLGQSHLVAAEPVVQDGRYPLRPLNC